MARSDRPSKENAEHLLAERRSFSILIRQHHRQLIVYAQALAGDPEAARDIVQEAFITAYRKLDAFDLSQDFGAWVRGIVRFKWREWMRTQNRRAAVDRKCVEAMDETMEQWSPFQLDRQDGGIFEALEHCITRLPERLRDAVRKFYIDETSGVEVAESLGVSEASVRKRLERARHQLKDCINSKLKEIHHARTARPTATS